MKTSDTNNTKLSTKFSKDLDSDPQTPARPTSADTTPKQNPSTIIALMRTTLAALATATFVSACDVPSPPPEVSVIRDSGIADGETSTAIPSVSATVASTSTLTLTATATPPATMSTTLTLPTTVNTAPIVTASATASYTARPLGAADASTNAKDAGTDAAIDQPMQAISLADINGDPYKLTQYIVQRRTKKGLQAFPFAQLAMVHDQPHGVRAAVLGNFDKAHNENGEKWVPLCKLPKDPGSPCIRDAGNLNSNWNSTLAVFSFLTPDGLDGHLRPLKEEELPKLFDVTLNKVMDPTKGMAKKMSLLVEYEGKIIVNPEVITAIKENYNVDAAMTYVFESQVQVGVRKVDAIYLHVKLGDGQMVKKANGYLNIVPNFLASNGSPEEAGNMAVTYNIPAQ